jgi:hypothetical protein
VLVLVRVAATEMIVAHDMGDVAAFNVKAATAGGGGKVVSTGVAAVEMASMHEASMRQAEMCFDWGRVKTSPGMAALDTRHAHAL